MTSFIVIATLGLVILLDIVKQRPLPRRLHLPFRPDEIRILIMLALIPYLALLLVFMSLSSELPAELFIYGRF